MEIHIYANVRSRNPYLFVSMFVCGSQRFSTRLVRYVLRMEEEEGKRERASNTYQIQFHTIYNLLISTTKQVICREWFYEEKYYFQRL